MHIVTRHYVYNPASRFGTLEIPNSEWTKTLRTINKPLTMMTFHVPRVLTGYSYEVKTTRAISLTVEPCVTCGQEIEKVSERYIDYGGTHVRRGPWRHLDSRYPLDLGPIECDQPAIRYVASPGDKS